ncbi:unnamed protein product [Menidia menidia]|uniref:(Atlantic silverside) hypothetical protein n=1 Tax=Menidia menidia TaxID=238744 RepID=A0A8S4B980_9TELE|nr:unnamed protein product [Menidia menidia]
MEDFVDNLIEDEAEIQRLRSKPTCFIIVGRPVSILNKKFLTSVWNGVGKSTLARMVAESWKCILIDGGCIVGSFIFILMLNSPDVEHYGYVLSCMPFLSEECLKIQEQVQLIRNFKLAPDFIINIKCADKDLVERLSGVKQHPITGQLYRKDQWKREEVYINKNKNKDQEVDDEEEQDYMSDHNPLYLLELNGNNTSEELHLSVMSRLGSMAIKPVAVPVLLHNSDDEELPESINTEDLLRIMASKQSPATGYRWRRSRWGRTCPVALIEGEIIPGRPEFSVGFQDKLYILSSQEAYQKFVTNPRRYLLPPMPRRPCRVSIIGLPHAGKTTMCKILAEDYNAVVLDVEELCKQAVAKADQEKLDKIKKETTQAAIEKIKMKMEQDDELKLGKLTFIAFVFIIQCFVPLSVTEDHPDVQAMVLGALEEAKQLTTSPHELYDEVLEKHIKEVYEIAAKYRERTFYFSSQDARDSFIQNPAQFAAQNKPLKPPALRIFLLGARGSGKSTHGEWLAQQLGLFHIQFREQLQMLMMAKTKKRVPLTDEGISLVDDLSDLETQIKKAMGEPENETDIESDNVNDTEEEVDLTEEEMAIRVYLSDGDQLSAQILDTVIAPYWKQEPYRSTGFILEGFPHTPEDVQYISEQQLFPDVVIFLEVDALNVQKRLLPTYLEKWREFQNNRKEKLELLSNLRKKKREEQVSRRRAELMEEQGLKETKTKFRFQMGESDDEEDEGAENMEDGIEAILEEEFPLEENPEEENEETEDVTTERLQMEIEERFGTDENRLVTVTELLSELHIPKLVINGSRKLQTVRNQLLQKIQPLTANRESLFQTCQTISYTLAHKLLLSSYKFNSSFGCWDPIQQCKERDTVHPLLWPLNNTYPLLLHQYIYFFSTKDNRSKFMLNPLRYLRQPKPTPTLPVKVVVIGPPKSGKTTVAQMFVQKYGLARLTIGSAMRMVLDKQSHTDLAVQMKKYLTQGLAVPDELAIQCLEVALMSLVCSTQGYVLDGFPITLKHAELMGSRGIIPMIVVQLELNTVEVLKRGLADKMKPNKPFIMHDSSEILLICNSNYKKEVVHIRNYFQQQYHNWIILDGLKSKWWIWKSIIKEISISMKYINTYLERRQSGKAACINRLCITPKELKRRLGEFCQYCPVCLALYHHLVDCSESAALTNAAEYKGHYYNLCGENHLEKFLSTPEQFVASDHPNALPEPHLLPRKLTQIQVKNRFPQQVEMKGFCPVTYLDGNQRYEALVRGKIEYAVEYRDRIYICETKQKQDMFLRTPETYWEQRLPSKLPPVCEPVLLTSLPTLGYLEQGVAVAVIKAMTAVGCLKPKYPFLSIQRSALLYVGFYLKAFNHKSTDYNRRKYKRRLALFEENCALIPYLSSVMTGNYKPASERPIDFEFKLNKFLALGASGANNVL